MSDCISELLFFLAFPELRWPGLANLWLFRPLVGFVVIGRICKPDFVSSYSFVPREALPELRASPLCGLRRLAWAVAAMRDPMPALQPQSVWPGWDRYRWFWAKRECRCPPTEVVKHGGRDFHTLRGLVNPPSYPGTRSRQQGFRPMGPGTLCLRVSSRA